LRDVRGARLAEFPVQVVVFDREDMYCAGEHLACGAVVVAFVSELVDPRFQQRDLVVEFGFAFAHAIAGAVLGVELVFEVGVFVGEFVAFHPGLVSERHDVQVA
jgi:hypothetical protein